MEPWGKRRRFHRGEAVQVGRINSAIQLPAFQRFPDGFAAVVPDGGVL